MTQSDPLETLARQAVSAYELPPVTGIRPLSFGNNASFEITTAHEGERFALRIHRPGFRSIAHTDSELRFLQALRPQLSGSGVQVPSPVPARDGRLVVEADLPDGTTSAGGQRHCDLLTWVPGEVLVPGNGLSLAAVRSLGRAVGLLHNAAELFRPPADFDLPRWDADGMFTAEASPFRPLLALDEVLSPTDRGLFDEIAGRTRAVFDALQAQPHSAFGVIHCDYILGNCHLDRRDGRWQVGVIDFDDCGWGYFLYDLCPLLGNLAGYPGAILDNPEYPALRTAFLAGYRTVRDLPSEWEVHLPLLMAARHANHCLLTAGLDASPTPKEDAAWRMELARRCLDLPC